MTRDFISAIGETLSVELTQFSIRVLIVEPGSFRTEGIHSYPTFKDNPIHDYNEMRHKNELKQIGFAANGVGNGDPAKAMDILVDVVSGEGLAKGRAWPLYLIVGEDAEHDVRQKCTTMLNVLDEWSDIAGAVILDD